MSDENAPARSGGRDELLVLVGAEAPGAMAWMLIDAASNQELSHGVADVDSRPPHLSAARTMLVLPGADAIVRRLDLAAKTDAQARAAAPYLFEGVLAAGAGETHYAVGAEQGESGARLVAAIAASRLNEWLEAARSFGAKPGYVWLDCTIWPVERGDVAIVETPKRTIVAGGVFGGFGADPPLAPALFSHWRAGLTTPITAVRLVGGDANVWRRELGADARLLSPASDEDALLTLVRGAAAAPVTAPNLLQGTLSQQGVETRSPWRIWRFAAALAVLALFLQMFSLLAAGWRDQREADQTLAAAEREFRAVRPEAPRGGNLRTQVTSLVSAMSQAKNHPVLAVTDPVIRALRAHPLVRLDEIRHETPGRTVIMRFSATQGPALEALAGDLRGQGLRFDVRGLSPVEGRYTVEVALESP